MQNLEVSYLGLRLKNPVIVSSSGLTSSLSRIVELERMGAGAIVIKSLFEEQIDSEAAALNYYSDYPEASDYLAEYTRHHSLAQHMELISEAKKHCSIPIIASINCVTSGEWTTFAKKIQDAGADALELNIFLLPLEKESNTLDIEKRYLDIVSKVCASITIPVSVKIGPNFTNIPAMVRELYYRGAKGVVMFNRFFEPDIDIEKMRMVSADVFSRPSEFRSILRWLAISSAAVECVDYAATTGIHDGESAVKALLAGASVVEICSTLYQNGNSAITVIQSYMKAWMHRHGYTHVEDFIGKMNYANITNPVAYERAQFMRYFSSHE